MAKKLKVINIDSEIVGNIRELKIPKKDDSFKKKYNLNKIVLTFLGRLEETKGIINLVNYVKDILQIEIGSKLLWILKNLNI